MNRRKKVVGSLSDLCGEDGVRPVYSNRVHEMYVVSESGDHHVEERSYHAEGEAVRVVSDLSYDANAKL